jgi:cysteine-rich repeat protein
VQDQAGNLVEEVRNKFITVTNNPQLTAIGFSSPTLALETYPTGGHFTIPSLTNNLPSSVGEITPDKCTSLEDSLGHSVSPGAYILPTTGDTLKCTIDDGTIIKGHIATNLSPAYLHITIQTASFCGNGKNEGAETCDDGNQISGDGCSYPSCQTESGYTCTPGESSTKPSECTPKCGDSLLVTGEECDLSATPIFHIESDTCAEVDSTKPFGQLSCNSSCQIQTTGCMDLPTYCPTVSGKYDSSTLGCWFVASSTTQNCTDICLAKTLSCSTDTNWNISMTLCPNLGYTYSSNLWDSDYSPVIDAVNKCKNDKDSIRDCSKSAVAPYKRICKCQ